VNGAASFGMYERLAQPPAEIHGETSARSRHFAWGRFRMRFACVALVGSQERPMP
jgi:hypothetical protein